MLGILYIVATPIGNLKDITLRVIEVLKEVDLILAEDTRVTRKLLDYISASSHRSLDSGSKEINNKRLKTTNQRLISYHQHSSDAKKFEILNYLLAGKNIALVSDAGTPGISDPGNELIDFLLSYQPDLKIVPIPGVSAITTALSVCGLNINKFLFLGFLPKKKINKLIELIKLANLPFIFYQSPKRIIKTLDMLEKVFGKDCQIFIGRELTKMHESMYRGTIQKVKSDLEKEKLRGEITVVVDP